MAQGLNNENSFGYEQYLFINTTPIPGVQSFQTKYSNPESPLITLGGKDALLVPRGEKIGKVSMSTLLVSADPFFHLTGSAGHNGYLIKDLNDRFSNYSFISGYMTSYSQQYSIGNLPQVSTSFDVMYDLGVVNSASTVHLINQLNSLTYTNTGVFQDIHIGCATCSLSDIEDNPLQAYEINISIPRIPIYSINKDTPNHVLLGRPIEFTVSLQMEEGSYNTFNMKRFPSEIPNDTITIGLKNKNGQSTNTYSFGKMNLIGMERQNNVDSPSLINLVYKRVI